MVYVEWSFFIAIYAYCIWHGIVFSIGDKVRLEWYPAKRLFVKEKVIIDGKEYRTKIDNETVAEAKESEVFSR